MVTAIVLITTDAARIPETARAVADIEGVESVYSCAGDIDLIAIVSASDHEGIAELIPERIAKVPGVLSTVTHIAFRSYSRRDTEDAFSIGMRA